MANRIKGITIEIDGNTTKLDKALEGTDKQLKTTQASLKDVNKLLKMDPGNADLLEQKQRLLADAVSGTKDRLETLRRAAEEADDALARGKAYEAKYGQLDEQLAKVSASYKELQKQKETMDMDLASGAISTEEYEKWAQETKKVGDEYKDLRKKVADAKKEMGGPMMDQSEYDALQRELIETGESAKEAEKDFASFNSTLGQLSAKTAGISEKAGSISSAFSPVTTAIAGIGAAALATVPATEEFRADMSMLEQNVKNVGMSMEPAMEAFRTFNAVSGETDSSIEALSNLLQAGVTESNLQRAVENLAGAAEMFPDTLKIESLADSLQESVRTGEATGQFAELVERLGIDLNLVNGSLSATSDESLRLNNMLDMLNSQGLAENHQAWVQQNEDLVESRDSQQRMMEAMADLAETLLPFVTGATNALSGLLKMFNGLPEGVQAGIGVLLLFLGAIGPVSGAVSNVSGLLGNLSGVFAGFGGSAAAAASAVGGVTSAAGGLAGGFGGVLQAAGALFTGPVGIVAMAAAAAIGLTILWDTNEDFRESMENFDQWITGIFTTDWSESFGAAGEVLNAFLSNIQNAYESVKQILGGIIDFIGGVFSGDWERAWQGVTDIFAGVFELLRSLAVAPINGVIGVINTFLELIAGGVNSLLDLLNQLSIDVPDWVPGIGGQSWGFNFEPVTAPQIPYLANGALAKRNNPFLAVVGDNPTQDEVISPYSTIVDAVREGVSGLAGQRSGAPVNLTATMTLDGVVLGRLLVPYIDGYKALRGVQLVTE